MGIRTIIVWLLALGSLLLLTLPANAQEEGEWDSFFEDRHFPKKRTVSILGGINFDRPNLLFRVGYETTQYDRKSFIHQGFTIKASAFHSLLSKESNITSGLSSVSNVKRFISAGLIIKPVINLMGLKLRPHIGARFLSAPWLNRNEVGAEWGFDISFRLFNYAVYFDNSQAVFFGDFSMMSYLETGFQYKLKNNLFIATGYSWFGVKDRDYKYHGGGYLFVKTNWIIR